MHKNIANYINKFVLHSSNSALLVGPNSGEELRELYNSTNVPAKGLIEIMKNEMQFWMEFLKLLGRKSESVLERDSAVMMLETALKRYEPYHLFLPNVDQMFYKYDLLQKGHMNASLRRIWQSNKDLTIIASVKNENSKEYLETLNKQSFMFYAGCWLPIHLREF